MSEQESPLPGSGIQSITGAGIEEAARRVAGGAVERKALFQPKDEEAPPPGENWFSYNYRPMPVAMGVKINVDVRAMAKHVEPFVLAADVGSIMDAWRNAKIEVSIDKEVPIVQVRLVPG